MRIMTVLTVNAVIYGPIVYKKNGMRFDWIARLYHRVNQPH